MRCDSCQFCVSERVEGSIRRQNVCKRFPPASQVIPSNMGIQIVTISPVVADDNWCGEYKEAPPTPQIVK